MSHLSPVRVRFCPPPAELRHYFTTFYLVEFNAPDGARVSDQLHPEWANLRFFAYGDPQVRTFGNAFDRNPRFVATGPSSRALPFTIGPTRFWGVGLLPLGWARYVGSPAADHADAIVDGMADPAFAPFEILGRTLFGDEPDEVGELARICDFFAALGTGSVPDEDRIVRIHAGLVNQDVSTVGDLVDCTGISQRTLERICKRVFGFAPQLLLRRQRFMRSLSQYMLDPSLKWIGAIDGHYHDQAQFVRDFKRFMGMTPRKYAAMDHPILGAMVHARARFAGSAVQTLDGPGGVRP